MYDKCFCFSCQVKGEVEVNVTQGTCLQMTMTIREPTSQILMATATTMSIGEPASQMAMLMLRTTSIRESAS